jgi:hypothetical protein
LSYVQGETLKGNRDDSVRLLNRRALGVPSTGAQSTTIDTSINRRGLISGIAAFAVAGKTAPLNTMGDPVVALGARRRALYTEGVRLCRIASAMRPGSNGYKRAMAAEGEAWDRAGELDDQLSATGATSMAGIIAQVKPLHDECRGLGGCGDGR